MHAPEQLSHIEPFTHFSVDELKDLVMAGEIRQYHEDAVVLHEEDRARDLYVLLEGTLKISFRVSHVDKSRIELSRFHAPHLFGELSFLDDGPRSATIQAVSPIRVLVISYSTMMQFLTDHHTLKCEFYRQMGTLVARRIRTMNHFWRNPI